MFEWHTSCDPGVSRVTNRTSHAPFQRGSRSLSRATQTYFGGNKRQVNSELERYGLDLCSLYTEVLIAGGESDSLFKLDSIRGVMCVV